MNTKAKRAILVGSIAGLALLAACGTPQERCIKGVSKELRTVAALRSETALNISRGYAVDVSYVPYTTYETCYYGNGRRYSCPRTYTRTISQPRTIDVAEEKRKLKSLETKQAELEAQTAPFIAQCQAQYPEGS